jgi:hypothetical protein
LDSIVCASETNIDFLNHKSGALIYSLDLLWTADFGSETSSIFRLSSTGDKFSNLSLMHFQGNARAAVIRTTGCGARDKNAQGRMLKENRISPNLWRASATPDFKRECFRIWFSIQGLFEWPQSRGRFNCHEWPVPSLGRRAEPWYSPRKQTCFWAIQKTRR